MNAINSIRQDFHSVRHDVNANRKRIGPVTESGSSTETDKKKQLKTVVKEDYSDSDYDQRRPETHSELLQVNKKYYRSELLTQIYNQMSGADNRQRGHFVEYYA